MVPAGGGGANTAKHRAHRLGLAWIWRVHQGVAAFTCSLYADAPCFKQKKRLTMIMFLLNNKVHACAGVAVEASAMLIPLSVLVYCGAGGIKASPVPTSFSILILFSCVSNLCLPSLVAGHLDCSLAQSLNPLALRLTRGTRSFLFGPLWIILKALSNPACNVKAQ